MAIRQTIAQSDTGASFPTAYGRIEDTSINLSTELLQVTLKWYPTQDIANSDKRYRPVRTDIVNISPIAFVSSNPEFVSDLAKAIRDGTILTPQDALKTALYIMLQQQVTYKNSVFI